MKYVLIAAFLVLATSSISAQNLDATQQYKRCMSNAGSMVETRRCGSDELDRQKALLNVEYKIAAGSASATTLANLEKAQKAWVIYRDLDCKTKSSAISGTGASEAYSDCMIKHIRLRKLQLENYWSL